MSTHPVPACAECAALGPGRTCVDRQPHRYDQCDATCTADCGHCKGQGAPDLPTLVAVPDAWVRPPAQARVGSASHRSSSLTVRGTFRYAGLHTEPPPYPEDEVSNVLVALDLAEGEAEHLAALTRTADRLASAYAAHVAHVSVLARCAVRLDEWHATEKAPREELAAALTEYEETRA